MSINKNIKLFSTCSVDSIIEEKPGTAEAATGAIPKHNIKINTSKIFQVPPDIQPPS